MSRVTTYTCDRCGKSSNDPEFLEIVGIVYGQYYTQPHAKLLKRQDWCQECLIAAGVEHPGHNEKVTPPTEETQPSLEDLVREIAEDVVRENCGG